MKVLYLTHAFPRSEGDAAGSFVLRLAQALAREAVEVQVLAPSAHGLAEAECIGGIEVRRFRYAPRRHETLAYTGTMVQQVTRSLSGPLRMASFLGANFVAAVRAQNVFDPDVIHAHWWFPAGLVGSWLGRVGNVPLVTTLHGTDLRVARSSGAASALARSVVRHSRATTTVSSWLAEGLRTLVPAAAPLVAPMPVDTALFSPGGARLSNRLLFVGRLNEQKGLHYLITALPRLSHSATLHVVGDGPDRASLLELASATGVAKRISWHPELRQREIADHYRQASAVIIPSTEEGLGLVAAEALLCETPVIAFDSGGLPDIIQHNRTGILVPVADSAALASAIDAVLHDPASAATLGRAGRLFALATFSPQAAARRYSQIYRDSHDVRAA